MHKLYNSLKECYSLQAEHFGHTRKKFWPELGYIIEEIQSIYHTSKSIDEPINFSLLELGCGVGRERLFESLEDVLFGKSWSYVGIDNAEGMIEQAKKQSYGKKKNINFICADMISYLKTLEDESLDIVLGIASVQHLMKSKERCLLRQHIYRVLKWEGKVILVNWSYSDWFLKKYRKFQIKAFGKVFWSLGKFSRNDIIIPWKDPGFQQNKKYRERYYHIFTLYELSQLSKLSGFVIEKNGYVQQDASFCENNWRTSRNTLLVGRKGITKK